MKNAYVIALSLGLFFTSACDKATEPDPGPNPVPAECGDSTATKISVKFTNEWGAYSKKLVDGDATFWANYTNDGGLASFNIQSDRKNICPKEPAHITPELSTEIDVNDVSVTSSTWEEGAAPLEIVVPKNGKLYKGEGTYNFKDPNAASARLYCSATCTFPSKGSRAQDSTYFFETLMYQFSLRMSCRQVK